MKRSRIEFDADYFDSICKQIKDMEGTTYAPAYTSERERDIYLFHLETYIEFCHQRQGYPKIEIDNDKIIISKL